MGEIAEMILEGGLCEICGGYIDDDAPGYPRKCEYCKPRKKKKNKKKNSTKNKRR